MQDELSVVVLEVQEVEPELGLELELVVAGFEVLAFLFPRLPAFVAFQ